jgi:arylsulfatase
LVIHWPARIKAKGEVRSQFTYVTDIAPTVMEAADLPFPKSVNGAVQRPFDGTSMIYSFDNANAKETHTTQYFEMFGNRGIYHDGWVAAARHSIPWMMVPTPPLSQDVWELYHVADDFSEAKDLAAQDPAKLKELQALFMTEAAKNHVLPIDDRRSERFDASIAGRPDLMAGRTTLTVYPGMIGMTENAFINIKNRSYTITAPVELADGNTNGVIIAQAGRFGGWTLYMKDGKIHHRTTSSGWKEPILPGQHRSPRANMRSSMSSSPMHPNRALEGGRSSTSTANKWRKDMYRRLSRMPFLPTRVRMWVWTVKPRYRMTTSRETTSSPAGSSRSRSIRSHPG